MRRCNLLLLSHQRVCCINARGCLLLARLCHQMLTLLLLLQLLLMLLQLLLLLLLGLLLGLCLRLRRCQSGLRERLLLLQAIEWTRHELLLLLRCCFLLVLLLLWR